MSKKSKPTVSTSEPWKGVQPYLTGGPGKPGIFPEAANLFQQGGMNSNMQNAIDEYSKGLINRTQDPRLASFDSAPYEMMNFGRNLGNGGMDTNFERVKDISTPVVGLPQARASQGVLDPTNSLKSLLSGQVANPYLDQQAQAMTANLTRNLNENVMPGIRSEALASGQYGGSRQGIAEGLAASRLNQDLAPALTNLYGGAFENAQNRMFGTATGLNEQAVNNATNNANRQFSGNQFNANLGLQNNEQQIGQNTQNLSNRMQGANLANNAMGMLNNFNAMQDNSFDRYMNTQQMPQNINWNNLNQYSGIISPGSGMGGTNSQTNYKNMGAGALGGALAGAGTGAMFGPMGAAIGGGLGLLGGLF